MKRQNLVRSILSLSLCNLVFGCAALKSGPVSNTSKLSAGDNAGNNQLKRQIFLYEKPDHEPDLNCDIALVLNIDLSKGKPEANLYRALLKHDGVNEYCKVLLQPEERSYILARSIDECGASIYVGRSEETRPFGEFNGVKISKLFKREIHIRDYSKLEDGSCADQKADVEVSEDTTIQDKFDATVRNEVKQSATYFSAKSAQEFLISIEKEKHFDIVKVCDADGLNKLLSAAKDEAFIKANLKCRGNAYQASVWTEEKACVSTIDGKVKVQAKFSCRERE